MKALSLDRSLKFCISIIRCSYQVLTVLYTCDISPITQPSGTNGTQEHAWQNIINYLCQSIHFFPSPPSQVAGTPRYLQNRGVLKGGKHWWKHFLNEICAREAHISPKTPIPYFCRRGPKSMVKTPNWHNSVTMAVFVTMAVLVILVKGM